MREFRELRKRLGTEPSASSPLVAYARKLLGELKQDMTYAKLQQGVRRRVVDGVLVEAISRFGQDEIRIHPIKSTSNQKQGVSKKKTRAIIWVGDFENGVTGSFFETVALNADNKNLHISGVSVVKEKLVNQSTTANQPPCIQGVYQTGLQYVTSTVYEYEIATHSLPVSGPIKTVYEKLKEIEGGSKEAWLANIEKYRVVTSNAKHVSDYSNIYNQVSCLLTYVQSQEDINTYSLTNPFAEISHAVGNALYEEGEMENLNVFYDAMCSSFTWASNASTTRTLSCLQANGTGWAAVDSVYKVVGESASECEIAAKSIPGRVVIGGADRGGNSVMWDYIYSITRDSGNLLTAILYPYFTPTGCIQTEGEVNEFGPNLSIADDTKSVVMNGDSTTITGMSTADRDKWRANRVVAALLGKRGLDKTTF